MTEAQALARLYRYWSTWFALAGALLFLASITARKTKK